MFAAIRLGQQRGDLVLGERRAHGRLVVPRARSTVARVADSGTPGEAGMPCVARPGARLGEQAVDVAVVGAGELDQRLAAGGRAGEPDRAHRRLGARRGHAQHVDAGHALGHQLGQLDLADGRRAVARAERRRLADRLEHGGCAWPRISGPHEQT